LRKQTDTPIKITVKFWEDLLEMDFGSKDLPDRTPLPNDGGNTRTGPHCGGGEVEGRGKLPERHSQTTYFPY
jgi:hypothetical protein